MTDDGSVTAAELARIVQTLARVVEDLRIEIRGLSTLYTPREVYDLGMGGVKIDVRRIDEQHTIEARKLEKTADELDRRLDAQEREHDKRFRQTVLLIVSAVVAPLTVALIIYVLTALVRVSPS